MIIILYLMFSFVNHLIESKCCMHRRLPTMMCQCWLVAFSYPLQAIRLLSTTQQEGRMDLLLMPVQFDYFPFECTF